MSIDDCRALAKKAVAADNNEDYQSAISLYSQCVNELERTILLSPEHKQQLSQLAKQYKERIEVLMKETTTTISKSNEKQQSNTNPQKGRKRSLTTPSTNVPPQIEPTSNQPQTPQSRSQQQQQPQTNKAAALRSSDQSKWNYLEKQRTNIVSFINISAAESCFEYAEKHPPNVCSSADSLFLARRLRKEGFTKESNSPQLALQCFIKALDYYKAITDAPEYQSERTEIINELKEVLVHAEVLKRSISLTQSPRKKEVAPSLISSSISEVFAKPNPQKINPKRFESNVTPNVRPRSMTAHSPFPIPPTRKSEPEIAKVESKSLEMPKLRSSSEIDSETISLMNSLFQTPSNVIQDALKMSMKDAEKHKKGETSPRIIKEKTSALSEFGECGVLIAAFLAMGPKQTFEDKQSSKRFISAYEELYPHTSFSNFCFRCFHPISENPISVNKRLFHKDCFIKTVRCGKCGKPFQENNVSFKLVNKVPFHPLCN